MLFFPCPKDNLLLIKVDFTFFPGFSLVYFENCSKYCTTDLLPSSRGIFEMVASAFYIVKCKYYCAARECERKVAPTSNTVRAYCARGVDLPRRRNTCAETKGKPNSCQTSRHSSSQKTNLGAGECETPLHRLLHHPTGGPSTGGTTWPTRPPPSNTPFIPLSFYFPSLTT